MDESPGPKPFLKLKLSSGQPAADGAAPPGDRAAKPEAPSGVPPAKKTPSPFMSPPPGLSPAASRTAPVKPVKPVAPGAGSSSAADDGRAGLIPPPAPDLTPAPSVAPSRPAPDEPSEHDVRSGAKLRLQGRSSPSETVAAVPPSLSLPEVAETESALSEPPATAPVPSVTSAASTMRAANAPASVPRSAGAPPPAKVVAPRRTPTFAIVAAGAGVLLIAGILLLNRTDVAPASARTVSELNIEVSEGLAVPAATLRTASDDGPDGAAPAKADPISSTDRARLRDDGLTRWLDDARVTTVSSDRITMNRHVYALGAAVNPESSLRWVGRDTVSGNLLFMDGARVVYEKSPR